MNNTIEINNVSASSLTEGVKREMLEPDHSVFELVIVATKRCKQLTNGARPRIISDLLKRKNTSIALEEVKQGLVPFETIVATA